MQPLKRVGPKGSGRFEPVSWDAALDDIAARLRVLQREDPESILPYSYAGTMGLVQGRIDGPPLLPQAGRLAAGPHHLLQRRRRRAGLHPGRQGRHAGRVLRRGEADPDLGQQLDRQQPALLAPCAGGAQGRRPAGLHRPAQERDGRQVRPAHCAAAGHRRRAGLRPDAAADRQRLARPRLHRALYAGLGGRCASAPCNGRRRGSRRSAAFPRRRWSSWRAPTAPPGRQRSG